MKTIKDIFDKVMEETYLLQGTVKIGDIATALNIIDRREPLIKMLEKLEVPERDALLAEFLPEYQRIDEECKIAIAELKTKMELEFYQNRNKQHQVRQNRKAHDLYSNNAISEYGSRIDNRK
ncbi:hypothetical protein QE109_10635 [Fusibacter bizertensis]|jgi:hypothetical protein|uniref:Flagellar protein FliT n=1 Tax=Fusibacter bizertensis TaxID=1488331 RepID=A0ABT6NDX8_9FIRM|nr:hypothetical protein [Fusibacter bizertensis]MDH8678606.1 hypothetical protein [Fusibacter bizertensis]